MKMDKIYSAGGNGRGAGKQRRADDNLLDLDKHLRGPPQNRFGGYRTRRLRPFKGSTFGAASSCRKLSAQECREVEAFLIKRGVLPRASSEEPALKVRGKSDIPEE